MIDTCGCPPEIVVSKIDKNNAIYHIKEMIINIYKA